MQDNYVSFKGQSFLEKEAANPFRFLRGTPNLRRIPRAPDAASPSGTFVQDFAENVTNPSNATFYSQAEKATREANRQKKMSTGSFALDGGLWGLKKIKGFREPVENAVTKTMTGIENADRKAGSYLAGSDPASLRGRTFSKKVRDNVGVAKNPDGTFSQLSKEDRRTSLMAPVEKTVKFTTPFLATAYLADKLYPEDEKNLGENLNQTTYEDELQKSSSIFDNSLSELMDKKASMQKIAELEDRLEKYAEDLEAAQLEKKAALATLEKVNREKKFIEKKAAAAEEGFLQKQAEHEELRLRTIAQKRSKIAVDLTEGMLEGKLIKQAQYQETIDRLMECDEGTIKMYESLVKEAAGNLDCLETLSYFGEYKDSDKLAAAHDLAKGALSKKGQTMGEAARDLIK